MEFPVAIFGGSGRPTVANVWMLLRKAAADSRIKAVVLEPESLQVGWGKLRGDSRRPGSVPQVRQARLRVPPETPARANTTWRRPPTASTSARRTCSSLKGMRAELMYFKGTLDKLGVSVQVQHAGKYKDFGDMFTRTDMSPETREVMNSVLDDLYGNLRRAHRARRGARRRRRCGPSSTRGRSCRRRRAPPGLVDDLRFEDQVFGELQTRLKSGELKKVSHGKIPRRFAGVVARPRGTSSGSRWWWRRAPSRAAARMTRA